MRITQVIPAAALIALLAPAAAAPMSAAAWSGCGSSYVVQWGDTLGSIAGMCGTSVAALRLANPGLGYWLYAGQTIWLPGAYVEGGEGTDVYYVARGDRQDQRRLLAVDAIAIVSELQVYG
jgi:LysM repeat protein